MGSISGGKIISYGRKFAIILSSIIGILGVTFTIFENITLILIGRLVYGYATGIQSVLVPRYIEETVPS